MKSYRVIEVYKHNGQERWMNTVRGTLSQAKRYGSRYKLLADSDIKIMSWDDKVIAYKPNGSNWTN